jgi:hypothetical protein
MLWSFTPSTTCTLFALDSMASLRSSEITHFEVLLLPLLVLGQFLVQIVHKQATHFVTQAPLDTLVNVI